MHLTKSGQIQVTVQELLELHLTHLYSALDTDSSNLPQAQRCGTATTLSGYTEWLGADELPVSLGWDWCITAIHHQAHWQREALPRSNIQLLNENGQALTWEDNLRVLATWLDTQSWQREVALAINALDH